MTLSLQKFNHPRDGYFTVGLLRTNPKFDNRAFVHFVSGSLEWTLDSPSTKACYSI